MFHHFDSSNFQNYYEKIVFLLVLSGLLLFSNKKSLIFSMFFPEWIEDRTGKSWKIDFSFSVLEEIFESADRKKYVSQGSSVFL